MRHGCNEAGETRVLRRGCGFNAAMVFILSREGKQGKYKVVVGALTLLEVTEENLSKPA